MSEVQVQVPDFDTLSLRSEITPDGIKMTATVQTAPAKLVAGADGQIRAYIYRRPEPRPHLVTGD